MTSHSASLSGSPSANHLTSNAAGLSLPYGKTTVSLPIPAQHLAGTIRSRETTPCSDPVALEKQLLTRPTAGPPLADLVRHRQPRSVAIIINDLTRSTPSRTLLPPVLAVLQQAGIPPGAIWIVVATGTHRPLTPAEIDDIVGPEIRSAYPVINHDCDSPDLVSVGTLSTGNDLLLNRTVVEADLRIAIGEILFHYYAGFAGGRKSLLPGVAGRMSIMRNHARMLGPGAGIGLLAGNPVHEEMVEALRLCPLHFLVNVILDDHKRIVHMVTGDPQPAWLEGVLEFSALNSASLERPADVVFASAGGYPKDINMYQAHKALEMSARALKDDGTLVLFAECAEGLGHDVFSHVAHQGTSLPEIEAALRESFRFGLHKLYYLGRLAKRVRIVLFSTIDATLTRNIFCDKGDNLGQLLASFPSQYGPYWQSYVIPQAGVVLPTCRHPGE